uniref:Tachykinin-like peptide-VI n=1 Tax=Phoneutria nigriventer TaxID=6918 RepID=TLP6_PHONI|nr:RecName: Full=Tachykinin-like peptide-VI; AltName: Full=P.nigriventer tachykinin peptides VI; Short=PnTkP-VI; AltName: Full=U29-ctenitoxin-Pn1f; Short=U29-CNTX-Pn1f [Phoneutria nigriventer]
QKKDRFLGLM